METNYQIEVSNLVVAHADKIRRVLESPEAYNIMWRLSGPKAARVHQLRHSLYTKAHLYEKLAGEIFEMNKSLTLASL